MAVAFPHIYAQLMTPSYHPNPINPSPGDGPEIHVGLLTWGMPVLHNCEEGFTVDNLLIGAGFHWQRTIRAAFRGTHEFLSVPQGHIHLVNSIPLELYLESVVGSEMNPEAPEEFLKAHAVISRSWALKKTGLCHEDKCIASTSVHEKRENKFDTGAAEITTWEEADSHFGFDVCSDDHCQRYQGLPPESAINASRAVQATKGLVLTDKKGNIADTRFHKCCGGRTETFSNCWQDIDIDYLISKECPWCDLSDMEPEARERLLHSVLKEYDMHTGDFHDWTKHVDSSSIRENLIINHGLDIGNILHLQPIKTGNSGRITQLGIIGERGTVKIGKTLAIRRLLAAECLKSSRFDIESSPEVFTLRGHGWGHGVGLCQIGAARMAAEGKTFDEILAFYYPGTVLSHAYK